MAGPGDGYSRMVTGAKVILPLAALALLSSLFLLARSPESEPRVPFANIEAIARDPKLTAPYFAGIAENGATISIRADEIHPHRTEPDSFNILRVEAQVETTDGAHIELSAGEGRVRPREEEAELTGHVRLTASSGYAIETHGVLADLGSGEITSLGSLDVKAPFGEFTAGALTISIGPEGEGQQMVFNEGVRLLYRMDR